MSDITTLGLSALGGGSGTNVSGWQMIANMIILRKPFVHQKALSSPWLQAWHIVGTKDFSFFPVSSAQDHLSQWE